MDFIAVTRLAIGPVPELIEWLQNRGLLENPLICGDCNVRMTLTPLAQRHVDGFQWRCRGCTKKRSLRKNSFFQKFPKVGLGKLLMLIYCWSEDDARIKTARKLSLTSNLVGSVFRTLEDQCSDDLTQISILPLQVPPGGIVTMKCDESKFNHKAKGGRGRHAHAESWVFGVLATYPDRPSKGYFQLVPRRDRPTLAPIIQRCVPPGTFLTSDEWGAYRDLTIHAPNVARHEVVTHVHNFVDPVTGAHTQEVESAWSQLKLAIKNRRGISRNDLQAFLDDRMWRQWRGLDNVFDNFLGVLARLFPSQPV